MLALNPMGKLPVLTDGEQVVTEVAAIGLYLADRYALGPRRREVRGGLALPRSCRFRGPGRQGQSRSGRTASRNSRQHADGRVGAHRGHRTAGLVEFRLHPPRTGNEVPNSYYVKSTLLFGATYADDVPEDGGEPRSARGSG